MPSLIQAAGVSPRFLDLLAREPLGGSRVLDVGCGSGRLTLALAPVCGSVVGLDRDAAALEEARASRRSRSLARTARARSQTGLRA